MEGWPSASTVCLLIFNPYCGQREEAEKNNNRKIINRIEGIIYTLAGAAK